MIKIVLTDFFGSDIENTALEVDIENTESIY